MRVRVTMDVAGRHVDETIAGDTATDVVARAKERVGHEVAWLGLLLRPMSPLTFAKEAVRRYNAAGGTHYAAPESTEEFLTLVRDLGYLTFLPDE